MPHHPSPGAVGGDFTNQKFKCPTVWKGQVVKSPPIPCIWKWLAKWGLDRDWSSPDQWFLTYTSTPVHQCIAPYLHQCGSETEHGKQCWLYCVMLPKMHRSMWKFQKVFTTMVWWKDTQSGDDGKRAIKINLLHTTNHKIISRVSDGEE